MKMTQGRRERAMLVAIFAFAVALPTFTVAQDNGFCDCNDLPSLGSFVSSDAGTYPPEIPVPDGNTLTIPLPEDGVLVFDNFTVDGRPGSPGSALNVEFALNEANTPVRLLVKGNVQLDNSLLLDGHEGGNGSSQNNGKGGLPGPGGFRGGDGGSGALVSATRGGPGQGPGGGAAGTPDVPTAGGDPARDGEDGTYSGSETQFPLLGGSGGGGGSGTGDEDPSCTAAGGGGGAGAIIIAANGTVNLSSTILARGGNGLSAANTACAGRGGDGGPGAVRIIANEIAGNGQIIATTNTNDNAGVVRLEAVMDHYSGTSTPSPARGILPGPVFPTLEPSLAVTSIDGQSVSLANGQPISDLPKGNVGDIDILTGSFDPIPVQLMSRNIPSNTTVEVSAKPQTGNSVVQETATLGNCDGSGACTASVDLNLAPGVYFVEAQATFQAASQ